MICDDKIPYVSALFDCVENIVFLPGENIMRDDLIDADILLVRTVTKITKDLLHDTPVKFVGSATTGLDHIDQQYLKHNNIFLADSAGANADAVAEYVSLCIDACMQHEYLKEKKVAGIIGLGRIGKRVAHVFHRLGFEVLYYDPFILEKNNFHATSLETVLKNADIISIHTPLTHGGAHPTFHILSDPEFALMKKEVMLINTARGGVFDEVALLKNKKNICVDVWENEPCISLDLLQHAFIATPHIAGYSHVAKLRATEMLYEKAAAFFDWKRSCKKITLEETNVHYDPLTHTQKFKNAFTHATIPEQIKKIFTHERKSTELR